MEKYMNSPINYDWTEDDVITEYERIRDKKKVTKIFGITSSQLNTILKNKSNV